MEKGKMRVYKRGNIWWTKFMRKGVLYQFSTRTKNKIEAQRRAKLIKEEDYRFNYKGKFVPPMTQEEFDEGMKKVYASWESRGQV
jgi:hypothetical protein